MRTKVTLVLIFLNVALFFFIFKFERTWRTEAASVEARKRVLGAEAADIRSLKVTSTAPGGSYALVKQRDTWMLTDPLEWPANPHAVSAITRELAFLEHEASFSTKEMAKTGQTLADFGLDKPKLTVAFTSGDVAATGGGGTPSLLSIGDTSKVGKTLYILSPSGERVHVVSRSLADTLSLPLEQLRDDALLTIDVFEARLLSIQTANPDQTRGGATAGVRVRIRRDGTRWTFESPITARASPPVVEDAIKSLIGLRAKSFNPTPAPAVLPSAAPTLRLGLEGNGRRETLFLGEPVPRPADARPTIETEYYAQLENRAAVFTVAVPGPLIENLRAAADKLRERHLLAIVDFDPAAVTSIALAAPGANASLTLQRLETPPTTADASPWQIVRRGANNQGVQTTPADRATVERFLTQLAQLSAQTFVTETPSSADLESWGFNRPEREITLTRTAPPATPLPANATPSATAAAPNPAVILRLGTDAAGKVYARIGNATDPGLSIYGVDVDFRALFPVDPAAWRDRTLPALPANARITALKLTDLASKQVVFETVLDAAGQPAADVRDPETVRRIVAQLRTPRAKSFRPEPFAERLVVGGEERAWKYQLDATVALPGREQADTRTLFFMERTGGAQQLAGSKEVDAVFEVEQPFLDALWRLVQGPRDPGPPPAPVAPKG